MIRSMDIILAIEVEYSVNLNTISNILWTSWKRGSIPALTQTRETVERYISSCLAMGMPVGEPDGDVPESIVERALFLFPEFKDAETKPANTVYYKIDKKSIDQKITERVDALMETARAKDLIRQAQEIQQSRLTDGESVVEVKSDNFTEPPYDSLVTPTPVDVFESE